MSQSQPHYVYFRPFHITIQNQGIKKVLTISTLKKRVACITHHVQVVNWPLRLFDYRIIIAKGSKYIFTSLWVGAKALGKSADCDATFVFYSNNPAT